MLKGACGTFHSARSHAPGTAKCPPYSPHSQRNLQALLLVSKTRRGTVSKNFLILLICLSALSATAFADEWTKTYQVGNNASLRVDTNDASIEITHGVSNTISARVIGNGYNIG